MTTNRKALLALLAVGALAACDRPAPTAVPPAPEPALSAELRAQLAAEQARIDSVAVASRGPVAVTSDGLLGGLVGGLLGTTTSLLTGVVNGLTYTLLSCELLPYGASTKVIGPLGGSIVVGRNSLVVPPGALSAPTVITMEAPRGASAEARFSPHGLQFAKPAVLTLSYSHCAQPSGYLRGIVYVDAEGKIVEAPPSVDNVATDKVTGGIGHFSGYLVGHTRIQR